MLNKMKLKTLVFTSGFLLCIIILLISSTVVIEVARIESSSKITSIAYQAEIEALNCKYHIVQIQQFLTDAALTGQADSIKDAKDNLADLEKSLSKIIVLEPELKNLAEEVSSESKKLLATGLEMITAYVEKGKTAGDEIMTRPQTGLDAMSEILAGKMDDLLKSVVNTQTNAEALQNKSLSDLKSHSLILSIIQILSLLGILILVIRRTLPLNAITNQLQANSQAINSASNEIAKASSSLATVTAEQAAATQETAASLEEIRSMVGKTSENSEKLKQNAEATVATVKHGQESVQNVIQSIEMIDSNNKEIVAQVETSNKEISEIANVISEIGAKTQVINDIVFQTKLLSFNASVEAARAGEHGKGFAVVASEIGNLANMSGTAAHEISTMLQSSIENVQQIITKSKERLNHAVAESRKKINFGIETAHKSGDSFEQIVSQVEEVNMVINDISQAISEQVKGLNEIGNAISELEKTTHANTQVSEDTSAVSQKLLNQVTNLDQSINGLSETMMGKKS